MKWQNLLGRKGLALAMGACLLLPAIGIENALLAQDSGSAEEKKKDELPQISKVTEGMEKREGFFILWVDEKKDKLYAEIPSGRLNREFLVASSLSSGQMAGLQAANTIWKIERQDDQALIVVPNTFYTASGELSQIVKYTYPDQVIATAKILGQGSGGSILIDLKSLLSDQARENGMRVASKITQVAKAKAFPNNAVVELQFRGPTGGAGMYFNLGELPGGGFKSRVADPRVGYFVTAKHDFSKDAREDTTFDRYINRWRLEKQDASLSLSPPKEPIVIYIEKTVPIKYRRWVKEGIESWNKAFEEIGFTGAIEVRQQTDTNQFKDFDPEDSRYNFFRWITSQSPFAIAPSRVDPRTGEILDSDILFDESMVRYYVQEYDLFVNSFPEAMDLSPRMRHWLAANPHELPNWARLKNEISLRAASDPMYAGMLPEQIFAEYLTRDLSPTFHGYCSIGYELNRELAFAGLGLEFAQLVNSTNGDSDTKSGGDKKDKEEKEKDEKKEESGEEAGEETKEEKAASKRDLMKEWPEEFIGPIIREIVAHEFGHTLGLRHNFKASSWKEYAEIAVSTDPKAPTVGSVMDYNPFTMNADGSIPAVYVTPTIGPYDIWAIEYGYAVPGSGDYPGDEKKMLKQITDKVAESGHDFGTDEDVASPDPSITRWDMGKNSLDYFRSRVKLANTIKEKLLDVAVDEDEAYSKARQAYEVLLAQRYMAASNATKYVGGYHIYRDHKGDPNARKPIEVVPAARQREAMALIVETLLGPKAIEIDPELQSYLAASRWMHRDSFDYTAPLTYPIQDKILSYQSSVLFRLTNPERIQYLYDSEFHVPKGQDLYTLPEMFDALTNAIWAEIVNAKGFDKKYSSREPMVDNLRRNLQREYLGRLINIATQGEDSMYPAVARTLAWKELKDLGTKIDALIADKNASRLDAYTAAHLEESSTRIKKALEAEYTIGGGSGSGGFFFIIGQPQPGSDAVNSTTATTLRPSPMYPF